MNPELSQETINPETTKKIRVLLADDHAMVRKGFRLILQDEPDMEVVGEAGTGREAVDRVAQLSPDVLVSDFSMPELDGAQATREIRKTNQTTKILILSMYSNENYLRNAMDAGANGYLLKNAIDVELPEAIRTVASGKKFLSAALSQNEDSTFDRLTPREKQVLTLIADGKSNKEIAGVLDLSVNTVAVHRANLMDKINIHKATDLAMYAVRKGLVTPP
jgi:DNA-binding NarL/FixJ family response regulator